MQVVTKTAPGTLPMSVSLALRHLRGLEDDVDLLELYCRAAVQLVEDYTGRAFLRTVYTAQMEAWPSFARSCGINHPGAATILAAISLPRSPLVSVGSVKYYPDGGGAQATWDGANYRADVRSLPGRLVLIDSYALPALAIRADAVEIEFTAGHGQLESEMPPALMMAALQLGRHFVDNPGAVDIEGNVKRMPYSFQMLLRSYRV